MSVPSRVVELLTSTEPVILTTANHPQAVLVPFHLWQLLIGVQQPQEPDNVQDTGYLVRLNARARRLVMAHQETSGLSLGVIVSDAVIAVLDQKEKTA